MTEASYQRPLHITLLWDLGALVLGVILFHALYLGIGVLLAHLEIGALGKGVSFAWEVLPSSEPITDEMERRFDTLVQQRMLEIYFIVLPLCAIATCLLVGYVRLRHGIVIAALIAGAVALEGACGETNTITGYPENIGSVVILAASIGSAAAGRHLRRRGDRSSNPTEKRMVDSGQ